MSALVLNMTGKAGGSGPTSDVFAFILATYPAGAVCTATNGSTTMTATDTTGYFVFSIPTPATTPETWTIAATDASTGDSASDTVSIASKGQATAVTLTFWNGEIFMHGNQYTNKTGGFQSFKIASNVANLGRAQYGTDACTLSNSAAGSIGIAPVNKIDLTDFTALNVLITQDTVNSNSRSYLFIASDLSSIAMNSNTGFVARQGISGTGLKTLDVSSYTGEYYVCVGYWNATSNLVLKFTEFYLS